MEDKRKELDLLKFNILEQINYVNGLINIIKISVADELTNTYAINSSQDLRVEVNYLINLYIKYINKIELIEMNRIATDLQNI